MTDVRSSKRTTYYLLESTGIHTLYGKVSWTAPQTEYALNNDSLLVCKISMEWKEAEKQNLKFSTSGQELDSDMIGIYVYPQMDYVYMIYYIYNIDIKIWRYVYGQITILPKSEFSGHF